MIGKLALLLFVVLVGFSVWAEIPIATADYSSSVTIIPVKHGYIREDGSIEPSTLPIERSGNQYSLKGDIANYSITIQKSNITFDGNRFTLALPPSFGFWEPSNTADALIQIQDSDNVTIKNTQFKNYFTGISINNSSGTIILSNNYLNGSSGMELRHCFNCDLIGNNFTGNSEGFSAINSTQLNIAYNNISQNRFGGCLFIGLSYSNMTRNNVRDNSVGDGSGHGIYLMQADNNHFFENNFINDPTAILFTGENSSFNNLVYQNYFHDNRRDILSTGGDNTSSTNQSPLESPISTNYTPPTPIFSKNATNPSTGGINGNDLLEVIGIATVLIVVFMVLISVWFYRNRSNVNKCQPKKTLFCIYSRKSQTAVKVQ